MLQQYIIGKLRQKIADFYLFTLHYSLFTIHSSLKLGPIFGERNCETAADIEKDLHAWVWRFFVAEN